MRQMTMKVRKRWRLKIMSGPGDTRGRGVLGHDRGLPILQYGGAMELLVLLVILLILAVLLLLLVIQLVELILALLIIVHLILVILLILVLEHDRGSPHTLILSSSSASGSHPGASLGPSSHPGAKGGKATGPPTKILVLALQPRTHCTVLLRKSVIDT